MLIDLPLDMFSMVIDRVVANSPFTETLLLRSVSKSFQSAVNCAFFERQVRNGSYNHNEDRAGERLSPSDTFRYIHGHIYPYQRKHPFACELGDAASLIEDNVPVLHAILSRRFPDDNVLLLHGHPKFQSLLRHMVTVVVSEAVRHYLQLDTTNILHVFSYQTSWIPRYGALAWAIITAAYTGDIKATDMLIQLAKSDYQRNCGIFHCLRAAAIMGDLTVAKFALGLGPNINPPSLKMAVSLSGRTVFEDACRVAQLNIVSLLLMYGIEDDVTNSVYEKAIACAARPLQSETEAKTNDRIQVIDLILSYPDISRPGLLKQAAMAAAVGCEAIPIIERMLSLKVSFYRLDSVKPAHWVVAALTAHNGEFLITGIRQAILKRRSPLDSHDSFPNLEPILNELSKWTPSEDLLYIWDGIIQDHAHGDLALLKFLHMYAKRGRHFKLLAAVHQTGYRQDYTMGTRI